ncbi:MAG: hydrogenase maturation protease [bacterium]|nr:MAG: hydrogenase maturation protease [bacterium]
MKTLILGLGNDMLSDDAVGLVAARRLRNIVGEHIDIMECNEAGIALLDVLVGYDRVIILDAFHSGDYPSGTVFEMAFDELRPIPGMSPHYAGLPEVLSIGKNLGLSIPDVIQIFAVEIPEYLTIGGTLSKPVAYAVDELTNGAMHRLQEWEEAAGDNQGFGG